MKTKLLLLLLLVPWLTCPTSAEKPRKAQISANPVDAESLAIYRDFLKSYNNGSGSSLNISELTVPFDPSATDRSGCLRDFAQSAFSSKTVHKFAADAFPSPSKLVDPNKHKISDPGSAIKNGAQVDSAVEQGFAAGLFTFSEIVFDASHTHAALSYSFHCGSLCGHGGTLIYEMKDGAWVRAKSNCGEWIS